MNVAVQPTEAADVFSILALVRFSSARTTRPRALPFV